MRKIVALGAIVLILLFSYFWWRNGNSPVNPQDKSTKLFVVEKGAGVRAVANDLKSAGLIKDPIVFFLLVKKEHKDMSIQAGDYRLSSSMNLEKILDTLTHGILDIWVTVPEGKRAEEIADILKEKIPTYDESWRKELVKNEGYLFPDTYLIPKDATVDQVISIMRNAFTTRVKEAGINPDDPQLSDKVIIASIIEKETKYPEDMPTVSSVIQNRLDSGVALQVDPSVAYALGRQANGKFGKAELTYDDLEVDSPYNTYKYPGLPPGPISNPGIAAIQAAFHPASTDYMYYLTDKDGHLHAAKTLQGHQANINKYL